MFSLGSDSDKDNTIPTELLAGMGQPNIGSQVLAKKKKIIQGFKRLKKEHNSGLPD